MCFGWEIGFMKRIDGFYSVSSPFLVGNVTTLLFF